MTSAVDTAEVYRYRLPLRRPLVLGGRAHDARAGLLLRLVDRRGAEAWGEAAPLPGFSVESLADAERALVEAATRLQEGTPAPSGAPPSVRFAVGQACDALERVGGAGLAARRPVTLNGLLAGPPDEAADRARRLAAAGYTVVKLKVGRGDPDDDAALARRLAADLPGLRFRFDANRAWSWHEALRFADALGDVPVDYLEEPLADPARLAAFTERTGLPVALDETVRTLTPADLRDHAYARAVVLKPTLLGWEETLDWMAAAAEQGVGAALSAAYESGVGLRGLVALAASGDGTPAGLDTYYALADDVLDPPLAFAPSFDAAPFLGRVHSVRIALLETVFRAR